MGAGRRHAFASLPWLAGAAALVVALGCGPSRLPGAVAVKGRVTFAGGDCPHPGYVFFVPTIDQPVGVALPKPGSGRFEQDGRFDVTTLTPGDGLLPGRYAPRIVCTLPSEDDDRPGRSFVPAGFTAPCLTVPGDAPGPVQYDVDVPQAPAQTAARAAP